MKPSRSEPAFKLEPSEPPAVTKRQAALAEKQTLRRKSNARAIQANRQVFDDILTKLKGGRP